MKLRESLPAHRAFRDRISNRSGRVAALGLVLTIWIAAWPAAPAAMPSAAQPPAFLGDPPEAPVFPVLRGQVESLDAAPSALTPEGGFSIDIDSRQQARAFFNSVYLGTANVETGWDGDVGLCDPGELNQAFKENVIARVNYFREMAGVPSDLVLDVQTSAKAQEAALMMSANGTLSHSPSTSWDCWTVDGDEAAGSSNLALGYYGSDAVSGYMRDGGAGTAAVGHRRWLLYPQTQWMGTGDIPPSSGSHATNALWVFDDHFGDPRPAVRDDFVAWPPPGYVPYDTVYARWSLSYPGADFSQAEVTMTSEGQPVPVDLEPVSNGYGENTLVWVADGLDSSDPYANWPRPSADTSYQVSVNNVLVGGLPTDFAYSVTVFDPQAAGPDEEEPTISGSTVIPVAQPAVFRFDPVSFAAGHEVMTAVVSPYLTVLGGETATPDIVDGTSDSYALRQDQVASTGDYSYHLAHPAPTLQTFEINGSYYVDTGARLRFDSRLGWASSSQVARFEVSLDDGASWIVLYSQNGSDGAGEAAFASREIDLGQYLGKTLRLRFAYAFTGGSYYPQTSSGVGFYVDEIELTGLSRLSDETITAVSGSDTFSFSAVNAEDYLLQVRAVPWPGFPGLAWGDAFEVSVSDLISWQRNDLDGDGHDDIVLRNMDTGFVFLWTMVGNAKTYHSIGPLGLDVEIAGVGDLNGDGKADIVRRNKTNGWVSLWEMDGNLKTYHNIGALGLDVEIAGVADLNGDGRADIVRRNKTNGWVSLWQMDGNLPTFHNIGGLGLDVEIAGLGDLNGDGRADIVRRNRTNGWVSLWEMDGKLRTFHNIGGLSLDVEIVGVADLTGDGKADLVLRNVNTGWVSMWEMDGNRKTYHGIGPLPLERKVVGLADLTGDGKADMLLRNTSTGFLYMWAMDGNQRTYYGISPLDTNKEVQAPAAP